ncbi:MAG: hypothetical protein ACKOZY_02100 [Flavobacteriales bacterium]
METEEIKSKLEAIFRKTFEDEGLQIHESMTANDVEKWTSLTHLVMIDAVEREFSTKLLLKEILKLKNVGDLIRLLTVKTSHG